MLDITPSTRELRFHLDRAAVRISYWQAPEARAVLLTVFRKTESRGRIGGLSPANLLRRPTIQPFHAVRRAGHWSSRLSSMRRYGWQRFGAPVSTSSRRGGRR